MFDDMKFRCSSVGYLMSEPKAKKDKEAGNLSEGAKTHCVDIYVSERYGRNDDISTKYMEKGLQVEEDGITLFSRINKKFFKKNADMVGNSYLRGTPDLFIGQDILDAEEIIDIKCSWDLYTFSRVRTKDINSIYWWQLQGYMALTGASKATLAYCLINTPEIMINDEKRKLMWKMGVISDTDATFQAACEDLDRAMTFDDIPIKERIIQFQIQRDNEAIAEMYKKIERARVYLNELHQTITSEDDLEAQAAEHQRFRDYLIQNPIIK